MGLNLASILTESAERSPDAPAIRLGDVELTYGALDDASRPAGDAAARAGHRSAATGSG